MEQNTGSQNTTKGQRVAEGLNKLNVLMDSKAVSQQRLFSYLRDKAEGSESPFTGENKSVNFTIRLTAKEKEVLSKVAESKGVPVADLVRGVLYSGLLS